MIVYLQWLTAAPSSTINSFTPAENYDAKMITEKVKPINAKLQHRMAQFKFTFSSLMMKPKNYS